MGFVFVRIVFVEGRAGAGPQLAPYSPLLERNFLLLIGGQLDWMTFEAFVNLGDSMIL